jgi:hypothetical protein
MDPIFATYHEGQIELDSAVDWPEGVRLAIYPATEPLGLDEATWEDTPDARAALLKKMDALEPLELTDDDRRLIDEARAESKRVTIEAVQQQMGL